MNQSTLFSMINNAQQRTDDAAVKNKENEKVKPKLKSDDKVGEYVNLDNKKRVSIAHLHENKVSMVKKKNQSTIADEESDRNKSQEPKQIISFEDFISENIIDQSQLSQNGPRKQERGSKNHVITTHDCPRMVGQNDCQSVRVGNNNSKGEAEDSKQSISFKDFLGMFKPASSLRTDNDTDSMQKENSASVVADQQERDELTNSENCEKSTVKKEISGCKSIASFFKPLAKKKDIFVKNDAPSLTMITVTAEVHSTPSSLEDILPKGQRSKKEKSVIVPKSCCSKKSDDDHDGNAIILLGSETITITSDDNTQDEGTRKRRHDNVRDTALESHSKKKKTSLSLSKGDQSVDKKDSKSINSCKTSSPPNSNQTGQCRLSFGASGLLTIMKQQPKQVVKEQMKQLNDEKDNLELTKPTKTLGFETKEMIMEDLPSSKETDNEKTILEDQQELDVKEAISSTNSCENISSQAVKDAIDTTMTQAEGWKQGKLRLRGRKHAGTEEKLGTVNVQTPEKVEVGDNDQSSKVEGNEEADDNTPVLRRSTRLRQSTSKKLEIIEVDDEEDNDEKQTSNQELKEKRKNSSINSSRQKSSEKSEGSQKSKVTRKLAPIFTRLKPAEVVIVNPPPPTPEELEKLKARQEFLMSGIPDELKRVQAAIALQSVPEYPPFPCPSHVQQIDREQTESLYAVDMKKMRIMSDTPEMTFDKYSVDWNQLQWSKNEADHPGNLWFQNFSSHPELDQKQVDLLMKELEKSDQTFPFREALDTFLTPKNASQTIGESRTSKQEDVIVVDDSPPCVVSKSKGNSKKHIPKSTSQNEVMVLDDSAPISTSGTSVKSNCLLWTDEHPKTSKFILGNGKVIKQLRDWLEEWHAEMQKEAKKALKGTKCQKSSRKKAEEWSGDSDFTDSSDDYMRLCNTMLITGPHGVGKTSTVFCLAQELGFKVFEVNPTSLRSGKQLQSQLEEATQSHRVVHGSNHGPMFGTPPPGTPKEKKQQMTPKPVEKPPVCKAFSGFFKKANPVKAEVTRKEIKKPEKNNSPKTVTKKGRKKKHEDSEIKEQEKTSATRDISRDVSTPLNITSASIILFDEADIVLEDDKGFLATVQHFMSSTKIPIIITSTNPTIHWELSPRHEHIIFKPPPVKTLSSFLHTVCLARGLRISHKSLLHLASVLKQDVRRCLLYVQYWCESGGGKSQVNSDPQFDNISKQEFGNHHTSVGVGSEDVPSSDNSNDSEFLSLRPARKRQKRMVFADEDSNSNSNLSNSEGFSKTLKSSCHDTANTVENKGEGTSIISLPCVHLGCDVSLIGEDYDCGSLGALITDLIKRPTIHNLTNAVNKINHMESCLPCHAVYNLAIHCCSLPKMGIPSISLEISAPKSMKKRKRIMIGDWFDSDGSDEEDVSKNAPESDVDKKESVPSVYSIEDEKDIEQKEEMSGTDLEKVSVEMEMVNQNTPSKDKAKSLSSLLTLSVLNSFSSFYESHSSMQYLYSGSDQLKSTYDKRCILPGISDEEVLSLESEFISTQSVCQEICGSIELLSARTFVKCVDESVSHKQMTEKEDSCDGNIPLNCQLDKDQMEEMNSLPIGIQMPDVWSFERSFSDIAKDSSVNNVTNRLGPWSQGSGSKSALHLDYLPVLREMCRAETERQAANMKRRFNHYLDHIGLNLKESTTTTLSTMYSVARN